MLMKQISLVVCTLVLVVNIAHAQTAVPSESRPWQRYSIKDEAFSVELPTHPAMDTSRNVLVAPRRSVTKFELGAYADGVVYTIFIVENPSPRESLDAFVERRTRSRRLWDRTTARDINLDGFEGKALASVDRASGTAQFFAAKGTLYEFVALGASEDDPRVKKFLSSISLKKGKDTVEVSDGHGVPYEPVSETEAANLAAGQELPRSKDVDKKALLGLKPEPNYTESARQHGVTGTVVLKCVFASNGSVTNIRIVSGLPDGLTERAIDAAKKIKFVPAVKDGKFVSMWMQLEYNFNLY